MSLVLNLSPELEAKLAGEAATLGISLVEYVQRVLAGEQRRPSATRTGAELVAYWIESGVIGTRPDVSDAQTHTRRLREAAQKRADL